MNYNCAGIYCNNPYCPCQAHKMQPVWNQYQYPNQYPNQFYPQQFYHQGPYQHQPGFHQVPTNMGAFKAFNSRPCNGERFRKYHNKNGHQKCKSKQRRENRSGSTKHQKEDSIERINKQFQKLEINEINTKNQELLNKGYSNSEINKALLKHFHCNTQKCQQAMSLAGEYVISSGQVYSDMLFKYYLLHVLEICGNLPENKLIKALQKYENNFELAISKLIQKQSIYQKKLAYKQKLQSLGILHQIEYSEQIPEGCTFLVDGFNVIPTNKHLDKLFKSEKQQHRLEAVVRLRLLIETLAQGYLVLDQRILNDQIQRQIEGTINLNINKPKTVQVVYADKNKTADDKIRQIFSALTEEQRKKILLVTSDNELIQTCIEINKGEKLNVIGGRQFIKCAAKLHDKGIKNKILINRQFKREWKCLRK